MTDPGPVGPSAEALRGASAAWPDLVRSLALPAEAQERFIPMLSGLLRRATYPHPELGGETGGAARVQLGGRAVRLLARHGYTDADLVLTALLLPWCDPALGGHREFVAQRPVVTSWVDAAVLATVSAHARPGQDPHAHWCSYLRHVLTLPASLLSVVVAVRRAWVETASPDQRERFDELIHGLLPLATAVPDGLRADAARPLSFVKRLMRTERQPVYPPDLVADPITHPDAAVERALHAEPGWRRDSLAVTEHDVGYLLWQEQVPDFVPSVGGRVASLIVDRESHAVTSWWEFSPGIALATYELRHRLFPLPPGWRQGPVEDGLSTELPALAPVRDDLAAEYRDALAYGSRWPEYAIDWRVGMRTVALVQATGLSDAETLRAGLLAPFVAGREPAEIQARLRPLSVTALTALSATVLLDAARVPAVPVGTSAAATFAEYVHQLARTPQKARAVGVAYQIASAEDAQSRFGGLCPLRRADLARLVPLTADLPGLRVLVTGPSVG